MMLKSSGCRCELIVSGNDAMRSSVASWRIGYTRTMLFGRYTAGLVGSSKIPMFPIVGSTYSTCAKARPPTPAKKMNTTANDLHNHRFTFAFEKKLNRHHPELVFQTNHISQSRSSPDTS